MTQSVSDKTDLIERLDNSGYFEKDFSTIRNCISDNFMDFLRELSLKLQRLPTMSIRQRRSVAPVAIRRFKLEIREFPLSRRMMLEPRTSPIPMRLLNLSPRSVVDRPPSES